MSLVEQYHAERKARLARMSPKPAPIIQATPPKPVIVPINPVPYWPQMWMWELVEGRAPMVKEIISAVAWHFNIQFCEITSAARTNNIVLPRQIAMFLARRLTKHSTLAIGREFGRDHTTVIYAIRKIEVEVQVRPDGDIATAVAALRRGLVT